MHLIKDFFLSIGNNSGNALITLSPNSFDKFTLKKIGDKYFERLSMLSNIIHVERSHIFLPIKFNITKANALSVLFQKISAI